MNSDFKDSFEFIRFTTIFDSFNLAVVNLLAEERKKTPSEIIRNILKEWIFSNPKILRDNYNIEIKEITKEFGIIDLNANVQKSAQKLGINLVKANSIEMSRITIILSEFEAKIIKLLAEKRRQSISATIRVIVNFWIEDNIEIQSIR